ncbi:hypothetical protein AX16_003461 [Volvariella volvacea WC 439]|nr:hypothetical protein AX16_003461 [Volvariella volvacea WC 439]
MSIGHKLDTNPTFAEAITNSQITNTGRMETNVNSNNMYNIRVLDHSREGLKQLKEFVVPNAMHTGEVRAEPLGCDEGTRQAIFDDILSWILDPRREKGVLWLRGPVGTGKSAIAKTTADRIDNEISCGEVAGSFFFFRGDSARNNLKAFVATLAYRLAVTFPSVGEEIIRVIESDPLVLQAHLDVQWRKLIIEPVISAPTFPAAVIIIDGLDECEDEGDQLRVLDLVRKSCEQHFRPAFLIASRPEPHITNTFHTPPLMHWCRPSINLGAIDIDGEMRKFIRARFLALYHRHIDILQSRAVDGVWPAHADVNLIALRAGGQYIYPLTLFRFLSQSNGDPHLLLQDCLRQDARAFIFLDKLYIHVMKSSHKPDNSEIGELLFLVIESATTTWNKKATLRDFDLAIVTNPENPSRILLRRLHSVLAIPSHYDAELAVHHQSFSDFLLDPYRSKSYYINKKAYALRIVEKCLMRLEDKSNMTSSVLQAICQYWWRCSTLLDRGDLSECVVALMVKLDFDAVVMHMVRDFRSLYAEEEGAYLRFVDQCQHWNYLSSLTDLHLALYNMLLGFSYIFSIYGKLKVIALFV